MEDEIPQSVINEWAKYCTCCPQCSQQIPCDGVMAGGMCDSLCDCDDDFDYETDHDIGN